MGMVMISLLEPEELKQFIEKNDIKTKLNK